MKKKIIFFLVFLIYPFLSYSHLNHYNQIKFIKMDILRNGEKIGFNNYSFQTQNDLFVVKNEISFNAKIIGLDLLSVNGTSTESYKNGKLVTFESNTTQNKKKKYNYSVFSNDKKIYNIRGSSFNGEAPSSAVIGNWWNHNILQSKIIISPLSGSLRFQEVYFLSKEILKIDKNIYETSKFKIELKKNADDKKKEEFYVWLDDKSKIILKVSYSKFGDWEYIIKSVKKFN